MMANFGAGGQTGFSPDMIGNKPPQLKLEGEKRRTVKVGEPRHAQRGRDRRRKAESAADAGIPRRPESFRAELGDRPPSVLVHVSGRGQGDVRPAADEGLGRSSGRWQFSLVRRVEDAADSAGNTWTVRATFSDPGVYVLRALAHDGGLIDYDDVTVTVTRVAALSSRRVRCFSGLASSTVLRCRVRRRRTRRRRQDRSACRAARE